jgi:signal transduction histidine kinase
MGSRDGRGDPAREERAAASSPQASSRALSELEVLQAISRAFGSSLHVEEAAEAAVRWVRAAVGDEATRVRLFLARPGGRLEPLVPRIGAVDEPDELAERQRIFDVRRPVRAAHGDGDVLVTMPLITRGEAVGVIEIVAPAAAVEGRWATLEAVASQISIVFRNLAHTSRLAAGVEGVKDMAGMATELVRSSSPVDAVRAAVGFCSDRFGRPTAGWLSRGDPSRYRLVSARGLGSSGGKELRSRMRVLRRAELVNEEDRTAAAASFAKLAGASTAEVAVAGDAVLMVGGEPEDSSVPVRLVEGLLEDVLDHLALVEAAARRNERLDLGIALTAHEVRGPLVGALAIIDRLLMEREHGEQDHALLHRSREQLEQLSGLVDALLQWAVAGRPLELLPTELGPLTREAADQCAREIGTDRVDVTATRGITVLAEALHLRGAIANVVRNALAYSPGDSKVSVDVRVHRGAARVRVRDRGPGVPAAERDSIFDPFMRGTTSHLARTGNGLGLFIARRVMEAHGGTIWLTSDGSGAEFILELPLAKAGAG